MKEIMSKEFKFIEPTPCKSGDKRVLVNGMTLSEDFRIISEDNYQYLIASQQQQSSGLPSVKEAGVVAITILEKNESTLTAKEEAFFVAGFQECIKWLSSAPSPLQEAVDVEERDRFAIAFTAWAMYDPQAIALREAGISGGGLLKKYKDRPYIDSNVSNQ